MIIKPSKFTLDYAAYLLYERDKDEKKKQDLFEEALMWKQQQHGGRSDICFELYENQKTYMAAKKQLMYDVIRFLDLRIVHHNGITVVDQKVNKKLVTVIPDTNTLREKAENFISDYILGAYNSTDST